MAITLILSGQMMVGTRYIDLCQEKDNNMSTRCDRRISRVESPLMTRFSPNINRNGWPRLGIVT
jgi:hypothetical protein